MSDLDYDALREHVRRNSPLVSLPNGTAWRLLDLAQRAEAAEAAVERVRALADEWEREEAELVVWYGRQQCVSHNAAMKIRDVLDAAVEEPRCACGHGEHLHEREEVPHLCICLICGDAEHCDTPASEDEPVLRRVRALVAPSWRPNHGHRYETTTEAYAAGRNELLDDLRAALDRKEDQ